jgi:hypothetical protein
VEQSRSYIELIFCGLHHFDLVLEMDEVLEFVSPEIVEWIGLTRPQEYYALEYTNAHLHLGYQLADDGSESSLREGTRLEGILRFGCTS